MPGLLADVNSQGHVEALLRVCQSDRWIALWRALQVKVFNLQQVGLSGNANDLELWNFCQRHELLLVTANRNKGGAMSLQADVERFNNPNSLPILTLASPKRLLRDRRYVKRTAVRLMEILIDIDQWRGCGRLWLP